MIIVDRKASGRIIIGRNKDKHTAYSDTEADNIIAFMRLPHERIIDNRKGRAELLREKRIADWQNIGRKPK